MSEILKSCFTWNGRLGRADFCAGILALTIPATAYLGYTWAGIYFNQPLLGLSLPGFLGLFFALWFLSVFIELSLIIRRLHDLGRPGAQALYMLVPFLNIYLFVLLFFIKGVEEPPKTVRRRAK